MTAIVAALLVFSAPDEPTRIVIPNEVFLQFSTTPTAADCPAVDDVAALDLAARTTAIARVAFSDEVNLVGHIEAIEGGRLIVLGRMVDVESAEMRGGGRASLRPGELVRVIGTGSPDGAILAEQIEVQPGRDPEKVARLDREVVKFEEKFWKKAKRLDDAALEAYLQGIVTRLIPPYLPASERRLKVMVVKQPDLNAFALPNGTMVVHTGIIARMENEAQLASILGHEMAHILDRHALRAMEKETEHQLLGWGALLAELALGISGKAGAAKGVELMSSAWLSGYSRAHEDEADQVGLRYLYLAGYDVREAARVWETFQLLYGDPGQEATFFYGSHSTGRDREHNLQHEVWKSYQPSGLVGGRIERERFLAATQNAVRENALLDLERGNLAWAEWGLLKALAVKPDDAATYVGLGRLSLKRGGAEALEHAAESFRHAIALDPDSGDAQRELGYLLERLGDRLGARAALERYLALAPDAPDSEAVKRVLARI